MKLLMFVYKAMARPTLAFVIIYLHFLSVVAMGTIICESHFVQIFAFHFLPNLIQSVHKWSGVISLCNSDISRLTI